MSLVSSSDALLGPEESPESSAHKKSISGSSAAPVWLNGPVLKPKERWGWYLYDAATGCYGAISLNAYMPVLISDMAKFAAADSTDVCNVYIGGIKIRPAAYASLLISISVLVQAIVFILSSSMADYGGLRKKLLLGSAWNGAALVASTIFMSSNSLFWLVGLVLVLSNVLFGWSYVFYNAYLPHLARSHKKVLNAPTESAKSKMLDDISNRLSSRSLMTGAAISTLAFALTIPIVFLLPTGPATYYDCPTDGDPIRIDDPGANRGFGYRVSICASGILWFLISLFFFFWVNERPGPPLPKGETYIGSSVKDVIQTFRNIRKLPETFHFLIAYFLASDGWNTIGSVGVLFATQELKADSITLGVMLVVVPFCAFLGNFVWFRIKAFFNISTKNMLTIVITALLMLPIFGLLGLIPASPIGLKNLWELYPFAIWYGFNIGAVDALARSIFSTLTPPGRESEFYGFYELTDKGSSWIGPAMTAILTQAFGSVRFAHFWLYFSFLIALVVLKFVDVDKGRIQAKSFVVHKAFGAGESDSSNIESTEESSAAAASPSSTPESHRAFLRSSSEAVDEEL